MRSSVDIQFSVCLIRFIPEPSFPSQGSQARGTRLVEAMKSEDGKVRKVKLVTRDVQTVKVGQNGTDICPKLVKMKLMFA